MTKVKNISIQSLINKVLARGFSGVVSKSLGASAVGAMMKQSLILVFFITYRFRKGSDSVSKKVKVDEATFNNSTIGKCKECDYSQMYVNGILTYGCFNKTDDKWIRFVSYHQFCENNQWYCRFYVIQVSNEDYLPSVTMLRNTRSSCVRMVYSWINDIDFRCMIVNGEKVIAVFTHEFK